MSRECGCPEWLIRCAHVDGKAVGLGEMQLFLASHKAECKVRHGTAALLNKQQWGIFWPNDWWPCQWCGAEKLVAIEDWHTPKFFDEKATAITAFEDAERELLSVAIG